MVTYRNQRWTLVVTCGDKVIITRKGEYISVPASYVK